DGWVGRAAPRASSAGRRASRVPAHAAGVRARAARAGRELAVELGRQPSLDELASRVEVAPEWLREVQRAARLPLSLETPLNQDGDLTRADLIGDDAAGDAPRLAAEAGDLAERLTAALEQLNPRE